MVLDVNVFGSPVLHRVLCNLNYRFVVNEDHSGLLWMHFKVEKDFSKLAASTAATYSASAEDRATTSCFFEDHENAPKMLLIREWRHNRRYSLRPPHYLPNHYHSTLVGLLLLWTWTICRIPAFLWHIARRVWLQLNGFSWVNSWSEIGNLQRTWCQVELPRDKASFL